MRFRILVVLSALLLAGLVPVLSAGSADAATMRTWDRLAHCESGGRWHIATGNGYFGGLQFSSSTWRAFGGKRYAALPHHASRTQQVRIAERVRHAQGWGAWPSCSRRVGLR
jgi:hypothetical protein